MSGLPGIFMDHAGTSAPRRIELFQIATWKATPKFSVGLGLTFSEGANLTATVQICANRKPEDPSVAWNDHDQLQGVTSSRNSNISFPVSAVRLVVTDYDSDGVFLGIARWP
jgi:hypothetical protein